MKRSAAVLVALLLTGAAARAQPFPGDPGLGVERGIQQLNNSGQVGTVTLFGRGAATRVVVAVHGAPPGRLQSVRVVRGPSCDELNRGAPAYVLADLKGGSSTAIVKAPEGKLLSGNYNVVVFSANQAGARPTACGHLYAS